MIRSNMAVFAVLVALCAAPATSAVLDLESALNGQKISGTELSPLVSISSAGPNLGAAIFNTGPEWSQYECRRPGPAG